jgi:hypothetical protein
MVDYKKNGFMIFNKSWIYENEFFRSLSHAEYRIMLYLLASVLRISKKDRRYKGGDLLAYLYQNNNLLVTNVSFNRIAVASEVHRGTVCRALAKFNDYGAAIKITNQGNKGPGNNFYFMGIENRNSGEKLPNYFVDSVFLSSGGKMPADIKEFIKQNYMDYMNLYGTVIKAYGTDLVKTLFPDH